MHGLKKFGAVAAVDKTLTITVDPYTPPTLACTANPTSLMLGDTSALHATATINACNGNLSYTWSASEGSISGTGADVTYNSSGVSVPPGGSKPVTATATATDAKTRSASCSVNLTVSAKAAPPIETPKVVTPTAQQLDDIVFAQDDARVNNCGKRTLERLYQQMSSDPDATIVLIGHVDPSEQANARRRNALQYDRMRVENTAAVLSAGSGTCQKLELSRVQVDWVGTDETDEFKTALCESSVVERARDKISASDARTKNRRVEVWVVPKGAQMPAGAKQLKPAPDDVKKLGCPK
jgi:outer membrane protein OmpA-like peptidoglycan-associated protein